MNGVAGAWISFVVAWAEPTAIVLQTCAWGCGLLAVTKIVSQLLSMLFGRSSRFSEGIEQWDMTVGIFYAAALGAFSLAVFQISAVLGIHLAIAVTTLSFGSSAAIRKDRAAYYGPLQLSLALGPMSIGLLFSSQTFSQLFGVTLVGIILGLAYLSKLSTSERLRADHQTRLFDAAINNMSHGLLMFDERGRVLVWNDKLLHMTGLSEESFEVGMSLSSLFLQLRHKTKRPLTRALISQVRGTAGSRAIRIGQSPCLSITMRLTQQGEAVLVIEDVTESARAAARIKRMASIDDLTGLLNRAAIREKAEARLGRMPLAIHLIDLDHFKSVNDTLGHPAGDRLLKEVAKRLRTASAEDALIGRMGGDEFIIVQPIREDWEPKGLGDAVLASLCVDIEVDGNLLDIGASIGTAVTRRDGKEFDVLLAKADKALYEAKRLGRNRQAIFETSMDAKAQRRLDMELMLADALRKDQFSLRYQPILDTASGEVLAFEALLRWDHPGGITVTADEFIPLAEETGQIVPLGRWAFERACTDAVSWPKDAKVAINFSARQFSDSAFPEFMTAVLERTGLDPSRIELEITEAALLDKSDKTLSMLRIFKDAGIRVCLDDFGAGFSSLSHLRLFPFDKIKVDKSFVRDMGKNVGAEAVVLSVAFMGRVLNIPVVAEGVETFDQLDKVTAAGCGLAQGYLLGRPARVNAIGAILTGNNALMSLRQPQALAG